MGRDYKDKVVIALWVSSGGMCSYPLCPTYCIIEPTAEGDEHSLIGEIAHIFAYSNGGPRPNPSMRTEEKNEYDNLILFCRNHHKEVDDQEKKYTVDKLRQWKNTIEEKHRSSRLKASISFGELDAVTKTIIANPSLSVSPDFRVIPPEEKMQRNSLTENVRGLLTLGYAQVPQVESYVTHVSMLDHTYPDRLVTGFLNEYYRLKNEYSFEGDELFNGMYYFASGRSLKVQEQVAGLAVLVYLFIKCDVFEK